MPAAQAPCRVTGIKSFDSGGFAVRRTVRRSIARRVAVVAVCLGSLLLLGGPASADDGSLLVDVPGDGMGFTHDAGGPFLDVQRLYPGSSGAGELDVRN